MGFVTIGSRGTVKGVPEENFDPESAAKKLYEGMKGLGTDENAIVEVIGTHNNAQRQAIKDTYKTMYGQDLKTDLSVELGGNFGKLVQALMQDPEEYIIDCIHRAIEGLGTDETTLIGLLCGRSNEELNEMKSRYLEKYGEEMEKHVSDDLSGNLKNSMISLMSSGREESDEIDFEKVKQDAQDLVDASDGIGTKESTFNAIFSLRNPNHLREVFDAYQDITNGNPIEDLIESEFSGNMKEFYLTMVKVIRNIVVYHAERLNESIKGAGTDDDTLIQIIVTRSEVDLEDIAEYYAIKFDQTLAEAVASDTSGDYQRILLRIIGGNEAEAGTD